MFALIIAIIAIALTVYLAVSTLFYGGDALSNGSARAITASFINQGQQINGAHTLYKNDNAGARLGTDDTLQVLVEQKFLSSIPKPSVGSAWAIDAEEEYVRIVSSSVVAGEDVDASIIPTEVCGLINEQAGVDGETFGCDADATGGPAVWYRL